MWRWLQLNEVCVCVLSTTVMDQDFFTMNCDLWGNLPINHKLFLAKYVNKIKRHHLNVTLRK